MGVGVGVRPSDSEYSLPSLLQSVVWPSQADTPSPAVPHSPTSLPEGGDGDVVREEVSTIVGHQSELWVNNN